MELHKSNQLQEKTDVKAKIIEEHTSAQDNERMIVEGDLDQQTNNLSKRLEERRRKMEQNEGSGGASTHLTNSSTPNLDMSSKKNDDGLESKSLSSGADSVEGEECIFELNLNNLADQGFSDELMNKLKLLQEGYDENDYDDDQLFDENAFENEIDQILTKCDEEVENM
jgi:hypothetical protein